MSEGRLSEEELERLYYVSRCQLPPDKEAEGYRLNGMMALQVRDSEARLHFAALVAEVRHLRAALPTPEEREALRWLAKWLHWGPSRNFERVPAALTALSRLVEERGA